MKNSNLDFLKGSTGYLLFFVLIYYSITLVSPALYPVFGSYLFSTTKPNPEFTMWLDITPNTININSIWDKILLFFSVLNYSILLYAVYEFRKLLILFQNNIIFEKKTQKQLKIIGKLIIWSALIFYFIEIILMLIHWKRHTKMFTLYLDIFLVGYFFNVLAEVFKKGRKLKEENELTI